jgi:hypothetical protein
VEIEHEARRQRRWRAVRGHKAEHGNVHSPPGARRAALLRAELLDVEQEVTL